MSSFSSCDRPLFRTRITTCCSLSQAQTKPGSAECGECSVGEEKLSNDDCQECLAGWSSTNGTLCVQVCTALPRILVVPLPPLPSSYLPSTSYMVLWVNAAVPIAALQCDAGKYATARAAACTPCAAGKSDHDERADTVCVSCLTGYYAKPGTAGECRECPIGHEPNGVFEATACVQCESGKYTVRAQSLARAHARVEGDFVCHDSRTATVCK